MPFLPNDPRINRKGRPVGSKDQKWKSAQAVWDMLMAEWKSLTPAARAGIARDIFRLHFERAIAQLPKEASDSVSNANKLWDEIKALETKSGRPTDVISDVVSKPTDGSTSPSVGEEPK